MIVKCEQCQTRFKIPDDKLTDKGVKVRCTKCQHTFRVKRDGTTMELNTAGGDGGGSQPPDPFSRFGPSSAPDPGEATRPARPLEASFTAQAAMTPKEAFEAETRVTRLPAPPPGRKPLTEPKTAPSSAPFDFSSMSAPAEQPQSSPFDFGAMSPPAPSPAKPFDFSQMSPARSEVTVKAPMPQPPPAPRASPQAFDPRPFDFSQSPPAQDVTVKATMPQAPAAKAGPSSFEPQPFDFSQLSGAPASSEVTVKATKPSAPKAPPPPSSFEPQPFDFSSLGAEGLPPPPPSRPPPGPPPPSQFEPAALDFTSLDTSGPPPPAPPKPSSPKPAQSAPRPARASSPPPPAAKRVEDLGAPETPMDFSPPPPGPAAKTQTDVPAPSGLLADVPFSDDALAVDEGDGLKAEPGARGALFDMAAPDAAEPVNQLAAAQDQVAVAKISLKRVSAEELEAPIPLPPPAETPSQTGSRSGRRGVVAMVWNLVSAAMLLVLVGAIAGVVLNEGKVDPSQSWKKLKAAFSAPRDLVAFDISNGLYDTRAGRPVFYVRGAIKNRGNKSGRVKVRAEILDGEDLIRGADAFAGATPSPEDLWGVTTAEDLEHLSQKLAPTAQKLAPGDEAPFLVAFYEYPPDLKDFRVRVTVSPDDGKTAAR